jgi:hypothetical protein
MKVKRVPLGYGTFGYHRKVKPTGRLGHCYRCGQGPKVLHAHPTDKSPTLKFCSVCHGIIMAREAGLPTPMTGGGKPRLGGLWPSHKALVEASLAPAVRLEGEAPAVLQKGEGRGTPH